MKTLWTIFVLLVGGLHAETLFDLDGRGLTEHRGDESMLNGVILGDAPDRGVDRTSAILLTKADPAPVSASFLVIEDALRTVEAPCRLAYTADIRAEDLNGSAYLELLVQFGDRGPFFARAIDQAVAGTGDWRQSTAVFNVDADMQPTRAWLGVRFEGAGKVYVDNVRLERMPAPTPVSLTAILIGPALGILVGLWGALTGILASRGKARGLVLGLGNAALALAAGALVAGTVLLAGGRSPLAYSLTLAGGICAVLMALLLPVVRRRYRQVEEERLAAADTSEEL